MREMAQWLRAPTDLPEKPVWFSETTAHDLQLPIIPAPGDPMLFDLFRHLQTCGVHKLTQAHTHTHNFKK